MVLSSDPEARVLPSALKATLLTELECPERTELSLPVAITVLSAVEISHKRIVSSYDPEARVLPSALKATLLTELECPERTDLSLPVATTELRAVEFSH